MLSITLEPVFPLPLLEGFNATLKNFTDMLADTLPIEHASFAFVLESTLKCTAYVLKLILSLFGRWVLSMLVFHDYVFRISRHHEIRVMGNQDYLSVGLLLPDELIQFLVDCPIVQIVLWLVNENGILGIAQMQEQLEQDNTPLLSTPVFT